MFKRYVSIGIGTILILFVVRSLLVSVSLQSHQVARAAKSQICTWTVISSPNVGSKSTLRKIDALGTNDIWAVGNGSDDTTGHATTLTEHWNGSTWNVIASPNNGTNGSSFTNVVATATSNVFAIGNSYDQTGNSFTLIEHWDGWVWSIMPSLNRGTNGTLVGVTALSQNNIWAVGSDVNSSTKHSQTLIEHWDGTKWNIVTSPIPDPTNNFLSAVTRIHGTTTLWAVGNTGNGASTKTLTEFSC